MLSPWPDQSSLWPKGPTIADLRWSQWLSNLVVEVNKAAAAGTLTGTTLAANVLASSLTSVGTLTGGATGAGFTIALGTSTITGVLATARGGTSVDIASAAFPLGSGQITFPATQNPSAGANTLDDYEEGTWTPVVGGAGGTSGQTYALQLGSYIKIGTRVTALATTQFSNKGTITGNVQFQGLPFASAAGVYASSTAIRFSGLATNWISLVSMIAPGTSVGLLEGTAAAGTANTTALVTADLANGTSFIVGWTYTAAA